MTESVVFAMSNATGLTRNVGYVIVGLFWLHVAVTCAPFVIRLFRPFPDFTDYMKRGLGWWIVTGSTLTALALGKHATVIFFAWVGILALREFFRFTPITFKSSTRTMAHVLTLLPFFASITGSAETVAVVGIFAALACPLFVMVLESVEGFSSRAGALTMMVLICGASFSHIALLASFDASLNPVGGGPGLLIFSVFITQFSDLCQYIWGKIFKGPLIVPNISPRKTWAGFIGGVVSASIAAWILAPWLTSIPQVWSPVFGAVMATLGFIGDITISAAKRDAHVKDAGTILPGFGGVLDRVDSLIFVIPLFVHALKWVG